MPKPKTSPDLTPKPYRMLKTDLAAKLSPRSQGGITYILLADDGDDPDLYLAITENVGGGGLWSKEAVRLDKIEAVLDAYAGLSFPTKAMRACFVGRSSNNPPFCLAVLKDLGLVTPAPEKAHQHVKAGDWAVFRAEWLAKPSEAVMYPPVALAMQPVQEGEFPHAMLTEAGTPEPANGGKGKKRKKAPADEVEAAVVGLDTEVNADEVEHAPTEHA